MSADVRRSPDARRRAVSASGAVRADPPTVERVVVAMLLAVTASLIALWPYTSVIVAGQWTTVITAMLVVVALVGSGARGLLRLHGAIAHLVALVLQAVLGSAVLCAFLVPETMFGPLPTLESARHLLSAAGDGIAAIAVSIAPMRDSIELRALICSAFLVLLILIDQLLALRSTLLCVVLVAAVGSVPMIVTRGDANVVWFVALAVLALLLLRHGAMRDRDAAAHAPAGTALMLGAGALAVTLAVAPMLPVSSTWAWSGQGLRLDATLRLGEDLRRPDPVDVLTIASDAASAPYLRIATLSGFDGEEWVPDDPPSQALGEGFGPPTWDESLETQEQQTSIRVQSVTSTRLPVPYPATRVVGVGAGWRAAPDNRTVVTSTGDAADADYTVTTVDLDPTLEQMRATRAGGQPAAHAALPAEVIRTALDVTAEADNDYDRLIALQSWFRSSFDYSLDTPVQEGFDGTGIDAVVEFLEVRSGYCIHFAGAFALMAKALDMPVRIVVGYLPGRATDDTRGDETIFVVTSDQMHAWPEVHFEGIGWVPFEPTASLGVPTAFASAETDAGGGEEAPEVTPSTAPTPTPTSSAEVEFEPTTAPTAGADTLRRLDPSPVMFTVLGALVVLLLPTLIRLAVRATRLMRARGGDAAAAWAELRDTLVDLRVPVSDAQTARMLAAVLVAERGADAAALRRIVTAVELAGYARTPAAPADLSVDLRTVLQAVRSSSGARERTLAMLMPRSLVAQRR